MLETGKDSYVFLLDSFRKFFVKQSRILYKEIKTIKYSANYYRNYETYYENENTEELSQEMLELEMIYDGIRNIEIKAKELGAQFNKNTGDIKKLIDNIINEYDGSHISILPVIDSKINQFKELFDELNFYKQSYFNLVDSKEFSYIPSPKFNKRFRNANLGLFINKQLNNKDNRSYRSLVLEFYENNNLIDGNDKETVNKNKEEFNKTNFFSTWSHTTDHLIKNFNSSITYGKYKNGKNIYISMSYAYLDKAILQPIAFHEISHAIRHKKLPYTEQKYLEDSLHTFKHLNIFKRDNPLDDLYKEILCDLSAVYATGYSYIISLIHVGFFELEDLFINKEDFNASCPIQDVEKILKIKKNEEMTPKKFDLNVNNIYLAVRLLILIKLCDKLGVKNTYINGIEFMLKNIMFPEDNNSSAMEPTFLSIYDFISTTASDFKQSRNLIYSLYEKFQSIILTKKLITSFKNREKKETLQLFLGKITHLNNNFRDLINENENENYCYTIYDLLWLMRENPIRYNNSKKKITARDINRLYNIYNLFRKGDNDEEIKNFFQNTVFEDFFNPDKKQFYNLELIKYRATKNFHPFVDFLNSKYDKSFENKIAYVFAPYDIAYLNEVPYKADIDSSYKLFPFRYIGESDTINKYFTDRHSLFLLEEINTDTEKESFDLIVQIKLNNLFNPSDNTKLLKFLLNHFRDVQNKSLFSNCKIFKSLGGEDYLIYISGIAIGNTHDFGKNLKSLIYEIYDNIFIEIEDLILLNNPNINAKHIKDKKIEIISFAKINKQHNKANEYFSKSLSFGKEDDIKLLPDTNQFSLMKIPTNRFDNIIIWNENKSSNIFQDLKKYLEEIYYNEDNIYEDNTFFSDFNIELMHRYQK